jgi:hypothetical protein
MGEDEGGEENGLSIPDYTLELLPDLMAAAISKGVFKPWPPSREFAHV